MTSKDTNIQGLLEVGCGVASEAGSVSVTTDSSVASQIIEAGPLTTMWMGQQLLPGSTTWASAPVKGWDWALGMDVDRFIKFISTFKNKLVPLTLPSDVAKPSAQSSVRIPNPNYQFGSVSAVDYGFYLPVKAEYMPARDRVMDSFQSPDRIAAIPAVADYLGHHPADRNAVVKLLGSIIQGYSRHEVDGRFGLEDERSWFFEITVLDLDIPEPHRVKFRELSRAVINHLITRRLAEEIGLEYEVWAKKLRETDIDRWVQVGDLDAA